MTPEQFCYWIQGLLECKSDGDFLSLKETQAVRDHLALVFTRITPDRTEELTPEQEEALRLQAERDKRKREFRERQISNAISATKRIC